MTERTPVEIYDRSETTIMHLALCQELIGARVLSGGAMMPVTDIDYLCPGWGLVLEDGSVMAVADDYAIVYTRGE